MTVQSIISTGQVVKAMILNGLGFVSAPLYLFGEFFIGKATEHLLGEGIIADGNESDKAVFAQLMKQFREEWNLDSIYVVVLQKAEKKVKDEINPLK